MQGMTIKAALFKLRAFIALIFIFSFFAFTADAFLSSTNLIILTKHVAINAILAIGMTFVILTAGIDLSVGSIVGLCGMIAGMLIDKGLVMSPQDVNTFDTMDRQNQAFQPEIDAQQADDASQREIEKTKEIQKSAPKPTNNNK